ncbi:TetR/AcrR family transcriptional regulator C-terminal ligand-binding domain-containing protein [Jannaschia sp. R86511]|uniref:TetR/AcrR family transcriptional regulator n=1 Tax=Jannaschia sp. R86511 TaxID=3093853 RepID=UPI0036D209BD
MDAAASQDDAEVDLEVDVRVRRTVRRVMGAAVTVLLDEGWDKLTHARVAEVAGCSKVTVYAHWPTKVDLLGGVFANLDDATHHVPTGDLRADLIAELTAFRTELVEHRLDRVLAVLAERSQPLAEFRAVRERFVAEGERTLREILSSRVSGLRLEAAVLLLFGGMLHAVLLHGRAPDDETIDVLVDLVVPNLTPETTTTGEGGSDKSATAGSPFHPGRG